MIRMIAAVSSNGVIGLNGKLPFMYKSDMTHFRKSTSNSTVIMGRKTFESLPGVLKNRDNFIISKTLTDVNGCKVYPDIQSALDQAIGDIWFIGGEQIYRQAMDYVGEIWLTITPDVITGDDITYFPWINPHKFKIYESGYLNINENLLLYKYVKV